MAREKELTLAVKNDFFLTFFEDGILFFTSQIILKPFLTPVETLTTLRPFYRGFNPAKKSLS